jgi:hypothetical protein
MFFHRSGHYLAEKYLTARNLTTWRIVVLNYWVRFDRLCCSFVGLKLSHPHFLWMRFTFLYFWTTLCRGLHFKRQEKIYTSQIWIALLYITLIKTSNQQAYLRHVYVRLTASFHISVDDQLKLLNTWTIRRMQFNMPRKTLSEIYCSFALENEGLQITPPMYTVYLIMW